jgi:predicted XRE-type DNA-binding protein
MTAIDRSDIEESVKFEVGSGNVFADIGFNNAEEMLLKSALVRQINTMIKEMGLSPDRARDLLQIDAESFANISKGRLTELSIEHLFRYLNILGIDLEVVLKPRSTSSSHGAIEVTVL